MKMYDWQSAADEIIRELEAYRPRLAGTFPIGLQIEGSDLDILCEVYDFETFTQAVKTRFADKEGFAISEKVVGGIRRCVVNFVHEGWPVELFGQPIPAEAQNGWRHMVIERRLLDIYGETLRQKLLTLKRSGMKTEPAFAHVFGLSGDPYARLLELCDLTDEHLAADLHPVNI
jgi:hypothetical protein